MVNNLILFNLKKKLKIIYVCMMDVLKFWFDFNKKILQILYICMMDVLKGFFLISKKIKIIRTINDWNFKIDLIQKNYTYLLYL